MRILLTNDDGVSAPGITLFASALRQAGHRVFIVAPDSNRSACSHSILFLNHPLSFKKTEKDTYSCSGTPADCVITGLLGGIDEIRITREDGSISLENAPDMVLSGINRGENLGTDIIYSGTAAAARQGSLFGIPSAALSLLWSNTEWHWDNAITFIIENLDLIKSFWKAGTFVNVNVPNSEKKPSCLVSTFPSMRYYRDRIENYTAPGGETYCFANAGRANNIPDDGSDWAEVLKNNAAYSLIVTQPVAAESLRGEIRK